MAKRRKVAFWRKKGPEGAGMTLTPKSKAKAKRRAKAAGRPFPNLVDNARASREQKGGY